jgi:hypothetical protein
MTKLDWSRPIHRIGGKEIECLSAANKPAKSEPLRVDYKYLVSRSPAKRAHVWFECDSARRTWSTGGIQNRHDWTVVEMHGGRAICQTCLSVAEMGRYKM